MEDSHFLVKDRSIVTKLLEQLDFHFPVLNACLVYENHNQQQWINEISCKEIASEFSHLVSKRWWQDDVLPERVNQINLTQKYPVYVYPFSADSTSPKYLVITTENPLNNSQQKYLQNQGKLLNQYLKLSRLCNDRQEEIYTLKQAIKYSEHQLRHVIALIDVCAENLYLGLLDHPLQEQAGVIKEATKELRHHINDLITGKQSQNPHLQTQNLQEIVRESLKTISLSLIEKKLTIDYPQTPAIAKVDAWQIKQVFDNILNNAIYYSPIGGKITCSWQVFQQEMIVEIRDCGSGFSAQALQKALNPDYSERENGTGLGLAIASKIILAHQGRLWVDNLPEGGAQVSFTLPH